jgi:exopolysaccharide biosynthesis polyprenyl glycosylphosphotransferase
MAWRIMRKKSELILSLLLLPLDSLAVLSAFVLSYILRVKLDGRPVAHPLSAIVFLKVALLALPIWVLVFALAGLYNTSLLHRRFTELGKILVAVSGGSMLLILLDFFLREPIFPSKSIPVYGFVFSLLFVTILRQLWRGVVSWLGGYGIAIQRVLVVGSGPLARQIVADLGRSNRTGYRVVAVLESARHAAKAMRPLPVYKTLADLKSASLDISMVIQADSGLEPDEVQELVNYASNVRWRYRFLPNQFGMFATNAEFASIAGLPVIEIRRTPLEGWGRIGKRVFDLIGSIMALLILSPVMAIVAFLIKVTDPGGPIVFGHKRLCRNGDTVYVYKFRTMNSRWSTGKGYPFTTAEEALTAMGRADLVEEFAKTQKLKEDPRVNAFGRFLRSTSLDELPQLWNVLRGDLSLVGPRPVIEEELSRYGDQAAAFLSLKPGITGMWQVSGRSDIGYEQRVKLDIYYVENWSIWLDTQILIKTVLMIIGGKGAY